MEKAMEEKIRELQLLEQNLQQAMMQRQNFQGRLMEIDNALEELEKNPKEIYRIVGPIMVKTNKIDVEKDLNSKKEVVSLRINNVEKNENKLKEKAKNLQEEVMKGLKDE